MSTQPSTHHSEAPTRDPGRGDQRVPAQLVPYQVARFILSRLIAAVGVVWLVATVVFLALRAFGDPLEAIMGGPGSQASQEAQEAAIAHYGLDEPLISQYFTQLVNIFTGDLGESYARKQDVADLLRPMTSSTVVLALAAFAVALAIGVVTVIIAAGTNPLARIAHRILRVAHAAAAVLPHFWLGAALIAYFAMTLGLLPATAPTNDPVSLILPVLTLAIPTGGYLAHLMDDQLQAAHHSYFATAARARGRSELSVLTRHSARHIALGVLPAVGWALGSMLSGAVVVEILFARPGLGRLLLDAAVGGDIPVVMGVVIVVAVIYALAMLIVDLITAFLDPRQREKTRSATPPAALADPANPSGVVG